MALVVVPTPIGNLEDITLRALRVLREADVIACEDTRRTGKLLAHYEIENRGRLTAYHEHNEARKAPELAERALTGTVALVTDAGTPLVSDPGHRLVVACVEAGARIEALPGPSAALTALVVSGLPPEGATIIGFPPRSGGERESLLRKVSEEEGTFVLFESPHRLSATLKELPAETSVAVCRELTKLYEEVFRGTAARAAERFAAGVKGEVVLVVRGGNAMKKSASLEEAVERARGYVAEGEKPSRAAARAARESARERNEVYERLVNS